MQPASCPRRPGAWADASGPGSARAAPLLQPPVGFLTAGGAGGCFVLLFFFLVFRYNAAIVTEFTVGKYTQVSGF